MQNEECKIENDKEEWSIARRGDERTERLLDFAAMAENDVNGLPETRWGRHRRA